MKSTAWFILLTIFFTACQEQATRHTILEVADKNLKGEIWQTESGKSYTDLQITDTHYLFADKEADTVLYAIDRKNPQKGYVYGLNDNSPGKFRSIEFVKSNTRYPAIKDAVWLIDDKCLLKQVKCSADSISTLQSIQLPNNLDRSTDYNFTTNEIFGVSTIGYLNSPYYFFNPDSGYYRVDAYYTSQKKYKRTRYAYMTNLCVNEKRETAVSALRFFNSVQFYNLRGEIKQIISFGKDPITPQNSSADALDFDNSIKCFIHIYGTDKFIYCLYDGSSALNQLSKIVIFKWNGKHVKTIQADHILKKIAVDPSDAFILTLASDREGEQIVVKYDL